MVNPIGNMTDDGEDYTYVYDPFGRLRKVESRANATLVAEYRYNGLNQRITTHFDTDADKDVDGNDVTSHFVYDGRWRMAARYEDTNTDPTEQWVFHHAGLAESGGSSYIDSVILRDRDTSANGTLDERVYYLQNWRADVVALITDAGDQIEQVRYEPYGSPFGLPAGDTDGDGDVDQADVDQVTSWYNASTYDSRGDLNMDGAVNLTDITRATAAKVNGDNLGLYSLSLVDNRKGYAAYEALSELADSKWDVRNRVLFSKLGQWDQRDPLGYVDGLNAYSYAKSPIAYTDPMGTCRLANATLSSAFSTTWPWVDFPGFFLDPRLADCVQQPGLAIALAQAYFACGGRLVVSCETGPGQNGTQCFCDPSDNDRPWPYVRINCNDPNKCRTLVHELVHARQCCEMEVDNCGVIPSESECVNKELEAYIRDGRCDGPLVISRQLCLCGFACGSCVRGGTEDPNFIPCLRRCLRRHFPPPQNIIPFIEPG